MKRVFISFSVIAVLSLISLILAGGAYATPTYYSQFTSTYSNSATSSFSYAICHNPALGAQSKSTLYNCGLAFLTAGHHFKTIEPLDSDYDGYTDIAWINTGTNPSDPLK
jgi:hypothetical protein